MQSAATLDQHGSLKTLLESTNPHLTSRGNMYKPSPEGPDSIGDHPPSSRVGAALKVPGTGSSAASAQLLGRHGRGLGRVKAPKAWA